MRRLVEVTPARVARWSKPNFDKLYGPYWQDLWRFLAAKYAVDEDDVRRLLSDAFRYIDSEVMVHGEFFSIPGFGTLRRMEANSHWEGATAEWMKVDRRFRKFNKTLFTQQEDEEDAGPRDE